MNQTDWDNYIYHTTCKTALNAMGPICKNCLFKFWWELAGHYGIDARIIEGQFKGGGGGDDPASRQDNTSVPAPTDPRFNEELIQ